MRRRLGLFGFGACVLALVAADDGQQRPPQQQPVFRASTELVQVDVVVRDADGNPVHGLTPDDFVVLDRRRPQNVATFKEIKRDADGPPIEPPFPPSLHFDVASNQNARSERLVVMILDDLHGYRGRDDTVKSIARRVVGELGPQSSMALVMTSGRNNVEVTEDRSRLLESIDKFKGERAVRRPIDADDNRGSLQDFDANMRLYGALQGAAKVLGANDGRRKAFVLISENVAKDLTGLFGTMTPPGAVPPEGYGTSADAASVLLEIPPEQHHAFALLDMMEAMRRGNVATYSIDPRGHVSFQQLALECFPGPSGPDPCVGEGPGLPDWNSDVRRAQHGLETISAATGGFAVVNTNDFTGGIDRIITDLDNYYLLGFYTDDTKTKGYRRLEVQVKGRRDVTLRYRRGYDLGRPADTAKPASPLAALTGGALPKSDLPLRVMATALPGADKEARVPVTLEVTVPRRALEGADAKLQDQIEYSVVAIDMNGAKVKEQVGRGARMVLRPHDPKQAAPESVTYQIGQTIELAPGRYQLRVAAHSTTLASGGSVYLPLDVPDFSKAAFALSGLVVGYAGGPRVPSYAAATPPARGRATGAGQSRASGPAASPPIAGGLPFPPSLDREFRTTDDIALYFEVLRRDKTRSVSLSIAALDRDDKVIRRYSQTMPATSAGKISFRMPLTELGPGVFRLRASGSDGVHEASSEIGIIIK